MRVLAAMSGGVDSAVAAARVVDAGHDVVGVHLALARNPATLRTGARGCCTIEDARDARRVADVVGIPFYVWDLAERFERDVIDDFTAEYAAGRTPNPCVRCNERIKFSALLDKALALGFDAVCTGHYARLLDEKAGVEKAGVEKAGVEKAGVEKAGVEKAGVEKAGRSLHRAVDPAKDQSYVLAVLTPERLAHAMFPLGPSDKGTVRLEAAERGLKVAAKPDSHDICFIADGDTRGWLGRTLGTRPGEVVDTDGRVLGTHTGAHAYTVGQRHGLALGVPAPDGQPRYVLDVRPESNTVVVGSRDALQVRSISARRVTWCGPAPVAGQRLGVQLRAHGHEVPAELVTVTPGSGTGQAGADDHGDGIMVRLQHPVHGVARGQLLALYQGTRVVGAGTIDGTDA